MPTDKKSVTDLVQTPATNRKSLSAKRTFQYAVMGTAAVAVTGYALYDEFLQSSRVQAYIGTKLAKGEIFTETVTTTPPAEGAVDVERGYDLIQKIREDAEKNGDFVSAQMPWQDRRIGSTRLTYPIFDYPAQSGLAIRDTHGKPMFESMLPRKVYTDSKEIPPIILDMLALIEDRNLRDETKGEKFNRAVNWPRTTEAAGLALAKAVGVKTSVHGASTAATQVVKNQSSKKGRTGSSRVKARQMLTATTKYYGGMSIEKDYLNTIFLAAHKNTGEAIGLNDGMAIWMGDTTFNAVLKDVVPYNKAQKDISYSDEQARALRNAMTLLSAVKMPDRSLKTEHGWIANQKRADGFIRLGMQAGIIDPSLGQKTLATTLDYAAAGANPALPSVPQQDKFVNSLELDVMNKLGHSPKDGMYRLHRAHMQVDSTLDNNVNAAVTAKLKSFNDYKTAQKHGLTGFQLLNPQSAAKMVWAFQLNEHLPDGRVVTRISTDTFNGDLDLTRGGKQNFGSTAKMRMAVTYLEVIEELHGKYAHKSADELATVKVAPKDKLSRWAIDYLSNPKNDKSKTAMLEASLLIKYSGARQSWYTGGGVLTPRNFDSREDSQTYTVKSALAESVNTSWMRITDTTLQYMKYGRGGINPNILDGQSEDPEVKSMRARYLNEFAEFEGKEFQARFWRQFKNKNAEEITAQLVKKTKGRRTPLAVVYFSLYPEATFDEFEVFMKANCKNCKPDSDFRKLYDQQRPEKQTDIMAALAKQTDRSPAALIALYRDLHPKAEYAEVRRFVTEQNSVIGAFKDLTKEFKAYTPSTSVDVPRYAAMTDRSPEQLAALFGKLKPNAPYEEMKEFILAESAKKPRKLDFRKEHEYYAAGQYSVDTYIYNFTLPDRGYLSRPVHELELGIAALKVRNPAISWKQAVAATSKDRLEASKWRLSPRKVAAQNRAIIQITDQYGFKEIEASWKNHGFPFRLVPTLASTIGVSGDTPQAQTKMYDIFLAGGLDANATKLDTIHLAKGTPYETHIRPGQPARRRVMSVEVAQKMLELTRGVVASEGGTARRLKDGIKIGSLINNSQTIDFGGKTGTNDLGNHRAGIFAGYAGDRFTFCITGYITGASPRDKFTSATLVQALKELFPDIRPIIHHSYKLNPTLKMNREPDSTLAGQGMMINMGARPEMFRLPTQGRRSIMNSPAKTPSLVDSFTSPKISGLFVEDEFLRVKILTGPPSFDLK